MSAIDTLNKLLGDPNKRELRRLWPLTRQVRQMQQSEQIQSLTVDDLPRKTDEFRDRLAKGETVDDLLIEGFALVVHACDLIEGRTANLGKQEFVWKMPPFDVQILGGIALHQGKIAEMKTGEGKTLVCTLPVYLNALAGKGVHVVTVNDYLAKRDSIWMNILYEALGMTTGLIVHEKSNEERHDAYNCDITYGTNNEFGFDYLRDNMSTSIDRQVQRGLHYAIVDEVDSILIDEARTPLIISQPAGESTTRYSDYAQTVRNLQEGDHYNRDEKQKVATLTEEGVAKMEELLGVENIYTDKGFTEVHHIEQALRAHAMYECDVDYVVKDGEIIIVDEFTGRLMPGRRYSHGLHQALEAKENVEIQRESKTLATITFQNLFRLYDKLAGMTGTAKTEEEEFESIYKLRTVVVPTNKPIVRDDKSDAIYKSVKGKFVAIARLAKEKHEKGQPLLIGTTSIEKSEALSALLKQENVPHNILNAKQHEKEAEIVAGAGQRGAVTIATNMAGRGTDIKLGEGVAELGGLCILGTERHESRRIDNQLRGRAGRQGDPGESQFFVSMEDDIMRLFGGDRIKSLMDRLKVEEDMPLQTRMTSRSIEGAQKRVEGRNFDIRRHVVQYDDVMNKHRTIIYARRSAILEKLAEEDSGPGPGPGSDQEDTQYSALHTDVIQSLEKEIEIMISVHASSRDPEEWNMTEIAETLAALHPQLGDLAEGSFATSQKLQDHISAEVTKFYEEKCTEYEPHVVSQAERVVTLRSIDTHWMDHIDDMSHLREQVAFAGYAQRDPLIEYKDQGFQRFRELLVAIETTIVRTLLQADFTQFAPAVFLARAEEELQDLQTNEDQIEGVLTGESSGKNPAIVSGNDGGSGPGPGPDSGNATFSGASSQKPLQSQKVGRNDPCPCGSGRKYKKCHGA